MSDYRPEQLLNPSLVDRVRRSRECGRVTDMPRDVSRIGGGMIRERSEARVPMAPKRRPASAPEFDFAAMENRLAAMIRAQGSGQGWLMLTNVICTAVIVGAIVIARVF